MVLGAVIGGVATLGAGAIASAGQSAANAAQIKAAREQMRFQERMSSTAYQRGVEDMRKAGLNPALAYQQGGASTPGGAQPQIQNPMIGMSEGVKNSVNTAMTLRGMSLAQEQTRAQTDNMDAQTRQLTVESMARLAKLKEEIALMGVQARLGSAQEAREKLGVRFDEGSLADRLRRVAYEAEKAYQEKVQSGQETSYRQYALPVELERLKSELRLTNINARGALAGAQLQELDLPRARNLAEAEKSWVKRYISPYMSEGKAAAALLGATALPFGLRYLGKFGRTADLSKKYEDIIR